MKKIVLTVIAALTMSVAMAQNSNQQGNGHGQNGPRQMNATAMTERLAKELSLTDSQKKKVLALNKDMVEQMQKQASNNRDKRQEYEKKLKEILTADQQKTYEQNKKNRRRGRHGRQGQLGKGNESQDSKGQCKSSQGNCCQDSQKGKNAE